MRRRLGAFTLAIAALLMPATTTVAQTTPAEVRYYGAFRELPLRAIEPAGWLRRWLENQRDGQTGDMAPAGHPFDRKVWAEDHPKHCNTGPRGTWACHEQTGYWIDGQMRVGHLLRDEALIAKARTQTQGAIARAKLNGGFIGPLNDDGSQVYYIQWPHVTFLRAFMADYAGSGDASVLNALRAHYDREIAEGDIDPKGNRHLCNVEQLCWLYGQTGEARYLAEARRVMDDSKQVARFSKPEYTAYNSHGVTFMEKAKTPLILYLYTGDARYLKAGLNAVGLLHRFHMLPDGAPSSCAGLFGDRPDLSHETCAISDYAWSAGYALLATGDAAWADRIERDTFNAGPGAVTKDFGAHQYYSAPNQAIVTHDNYGQLAAYSPGHGPECCSGNIHRFMPNYVARMWMADADGRGVVAAMYGPGQATFDVAGRPVTIVERTAYPFADRVEFVVRADAPARFALSLRIPGWCDAATITVNGQPAGVATRAGTFARVEREFAPGDRVVLELPAKVRVRRWPGNGLIVERGPLLFALDIPTKTTKDAKDKRGRDPRFPAYDMKPAAGAAWRYALDLPIGEVDAQVVVDRADVGDQPFAIGANVFTIDVPARAIPDAEWPLRESVGDDRTSVMTPWPTRWAGAQAAPRQTIRLVPYGATCLRIAILPDAAKAASDIPATRPADFKAIEAD